MIMEEAIFNLLTKAKNANIKQEISRIRSKFSSDTKVNIHIDNIILATLDDLSSSYQKQFAVYDSMLDLVWEKLNTGHWAYVENSWRLLHSMISLLKARTLIYFINDNKKQLSEKNVSQLYQDTVKICDIALIMGAPVLDNICGKLANSICMYLTPISTQCLEHPFGQIGKRKRTNCQIGQSKNVVELAHEYELSIERFVNRFKSRKIPVIIKNALWHWPALADNSDHLWTVPYLKRVAGYRTVPVEIGSRYTDDDWTQTLMTINDFIDNYVENPSPQRKGYLAQHNLFDQITELADDFDIPEYCYTGEDTDDIAVNIWFGPKNTVSPLHTDPKDNCLCQVFGTKYVRLYTDDQSEYLSAFENGILTNTSQIDIDKSDDDISKEFPDFSKANGYECILEEGDILYIPSKCWHFVKSLSTSCSLSFWFK